MGLSFISADGLGLTIASGAEFFWAVLLWPVAGMGSCSVKQGPDGFQRGIKRKGGELKKEV